MRSSLYFMIVAQRLTCVRSLTPFIQSYGACPCDQYEGTKQITFDVGTQMRVADVFFFGDAEIFSIIFRPRRDTRKLHPDYNEPSKYVTSKIRKKIKCKKLKNIQIINDHSEHRE